MLLSVPENRSTKRAPISLSCLLRLSGSMFMFADLSFSWTLCSLSLSLSAVGPGFLLSL